MNRRDPEKQLADAQATIRMLTDELHAAHDELEKTNSELLQLTLELEDRVEERTKALQASEKELKKHRNHLQELVAERTNELRIVNQQLKNKVNELAASEDRFRSLVTTIPDIVYKVDRQGYFTFVNEAITILGYDSEELIDKHFSEIILPAEIENVSRQAVLPKYRNKVTGDKAAPKLFDERRSSPRRTEGLEVRLITKTKEIKPGVMEPIGQEMIVAEVNSAGMYTANGDKSNKVFIGSVGVIRDITLRKQMEKELKKHQEELEKLVELRTDELKKSQAQLIQTEKIAALGVLTAGIAHELNNPMMGMINFIQYALKQTPREKKAHQVLLDAERETRRCINIVKNLLTFSRIEGNEKEAVQKIQLSVVVNRVLQLLAYRIKAENIDLKMYFNKNLPDVYVKASNIQQVFLNLIGNALDALKKTDQKQIDIMARVEKDTIKISIRDSGQGIEPQIMPKIFDPFFTTKPVGTGTGLGLCVSRNIIQDCGGRIECRSDAGRGTTFDVWLPTKNMET